MQRIDWIAVVKLMIDAIRGETDDKLLRTCVESALACEQGDTCDAAITSEDWADFDDWREYHRDRSGH